MTKRMSKASALTGFTLVELMVTLVVATILLTIAIPAYMTQIRESRGDPVQHAKPLLSGALRAGIFR